MVWRLSRCFILKSVQDLLKNNYLFFVLNRFWVRTSISALAYHSKVWWKKSRMFSSPLFFYLTNRRQFNLINENSLETGNLQYANVQGFSFHFSGTFTWPAPVFVHLSSSGLASLTIWAAPTTTLLPALEFKHLRDAGDSIAYTVQLAVYYLYGCTYSLK